MYNITMNDRHGHYDAIGQELVTDPEEAVVYFEFVATPVITKAINAYLQMAEHRENSELTWNNGYPIRLAPEGRYWSAARTMPCGLQDVVICHQGLGPSGNTPQTYFLAEGNTMPRDWPSRLRGAVPIGMLDEWPPRLWDMLTNIPATHSFHQALTRLESRGDVEVWQLASTDTRLWHRILRELVLEGAYGQAG